MMPKAAFVIAKGSARWVEKPQAAGGRLSIEFADLVFLIPLVE